MHYAETDHAIDEDFPAIVPHIENAEIGQRIGASYLDYVNINQMYDCYGKLCDNTCLVLIINVQLSYFAPLIVRISLLYMFAL